MRPNDVSNSHKLEICRKILDDEELNESEKVGLIRKTVSMKAACHLPKEIKYTIEEICLQIEEFTHLKKQDFCSATRKSGIVRVRQMAHYKSVRFTSESLPSIGYFFGKKDHATVWHSCKSISNLLETDKRFRQRYEEFLTK